MSPSPEPPTLGQRDLDAEHEVRRRLHASPSAATLAGARLQRINAGSSHHAWQAVTRSGERCFVRLASADAVALGADLQMEARVLARVAGMGLAPRVLHVDPAQGLLVTEWIDAVEPELMSQPGAVPVVAACLARLHASPTAADLRIVDFPAQAAGLRGRVPSSPGLDSLASHAEAVFEASARLRQERCLCHNDLNPSNVLVDRAGRMWFVDWEYTGLGDPAYDVASFASQHGLDRAGCAALLSAYRAHGGELDDRRLELAAWGFDYVQALWYRALAAAPQESALDRDAALERATRLENSLHHRASDVLRGDNAAFGS